MNVEVRYVVTFVLLMLIVLVAKCVKEATVVMTYIGATFAVLLMAFFPAFIISVFCDRRMDFLASYSLYAYTGLGLLGFITKCYY